MSGMRRMPQQLCKERFAQILVALKRQPYIYQSYGIPVLTILQIVRSFFTQMSHPENEERNKYKFSFFCAVGKILGNIVLIFGRRELLRIETTLSVPPGGDSLQIIWTCHKLFKNIDQWVWQSNFSTIMVQYHSFHLFEMDFGYCQPKVSTPNKELKKAQM